MICTCFGSRIADSLSFKSCWPIKSKLAPVTSVISPFSRPLGGKCSRIRTIWICRFSSRLESVWNIKVGGEVLLRSDAKDHHVGLWGIWVFFVKGHQKLGGGNSKIVYVHPEPWGRFPFWFHIFQMGWNHQLGSVLIHIPRDPEWFHGR